MQDAFFTFHPPCGMDLAKRGSVVPVLPFAVVRGITLLSRKAELYISSLRSPSILLSYRFRWSHKRSKVSLHVSSHMEADSSPSYWATVWLPSGLANHCQSCQQSVRFFKVTSPVGKFFLPQPHWLPLKQARNNPLNLDYPRNLHHLDITCCIPHFVEQVVALWLMMSAFYSQTQEAKAMI